VWSSSSIACECPPTPRVRRSSDFERRAKSHPFSAIPPNSDTEIGRPANSTGRRNRTPKSDDRPTRPDAEIGHRDRTAIAADAADATGPEIGHRNRTVNAGGGDRLPKSDADFGGSAEMQVTSGGVRFRTIEPRARTIEPRASTIEPQTRRKPPPSSHRTPPAVGPASARRRTPRRGRGGRPPRARRA
jgi:hypothetical protein